MRARIVYCSGSQAIGRKRFKQFRESRGPAFQNVEQRRLIGVLRGTTKTGGHAMGFGRGLLLWLIGIPLPIIILLAIFMHH
jgi:hypothetical protein